MRQLWRGDGHMARLFERLDLHGDVGAAVNGQRPDALLLLGEQRQLLRDLLAELAGRSQDDGLGEIGLGIEQVKQRQPEGGRLAGAGLGEADEVRVPTEQVRDGLLLNFSGRLEAKGSDGVEEGGRKAEVGKGGQHAGIGRKVRPETGIPPWPLESSHYGAGAGVEPAQTVR